MDEAEKKKVVKKKTTAHWETWMRALVIVRFFVYDTFFFQKATKSIGREKWL